MYCFGVLRSVTLSPRASRSRSRWRIFSRSVATDFMRRERVSVARSGIASVSTVAIAAIAANTAASIRGLFTCSIRISIIGGRPLEIEVDHLAHDHHARTHPEGAA